MFTRRRLFISHASADDELARKLAEHLRSHGLRPFVDHSEEDGIAVGEAWERRLRDELRGTRAVVLCLSKAWLESDWCKAEDRTARLLGRPVIPLVLEDCEHEPFAHDVQKIHLPDASDASIASAAKAIAGAVPSRAKYALLLPVLATTLCTLAIEERPLGPWERASMPGGVFRALGGGDAVNGRLVAGTISYEGLGDVSLMESFDCGESWTEVALPPGATEINDVAVDAARDFIATDHGLWKRETQDADWTLHLDRGISDEFLFVEIWPQRPSSVLSGSQRPGGTSAGGGVAAASGNEGSLAGSSDPRSGGLHIDDLTEATSTTFSPPANDVAFHPLLPDEAVIASGDRGLFTLSTSGRLTVQPVDFPGRRPLRVAYSRSGDRLFVGTMGDGLWVRERTGETDSWRAYPSTADREILAIWVDERSSRILATSRRGVLVSSDDGESFTEEPSQPVERHINRLLSCGDYELGASGGAGIARRHRGELVWQWHNSPTVPQPSYASIAVGNARLAAAGAYLLRSVDGGSSYEPVLAPGSNVLRIAAHVAPAARSSPRGGFAITTDAEGTTAAHDSYDRATILAGTGSGAIWRKAPASQEWEAVAHGDSPVQGLVLMDIEPPVAFAVWQRSPPQRSDDLGTSWTRMEDPKMSDAITAFASGRDSVLFALLSGGLLRYRLQDGALQPVKGLADTVITGFAEDPAGEMALAVSHDGSVFVSNPPGSPFRAEERLPIEGADGWNRLACCGRRGRFYAATREGLFVSSTDATRWEPLLGGELAGATVNAVSIEDGAVSDVATASGLLRPSSRLMLCPIDSCYTLSLNRLRQRLGLGPT